ncbi:hypothetical protein MPER_01897, partial [Moniliophthora perniciosa FA553]
MLFRQKLKLGQITPEGTKEGPFCMDTYRWMFDCCRLPGPHGLDWSASYAKEGDTGTEDAHIIVFRYNRPYKVVAATGGRILSMDELQKQIQEIYDTTKTEYPGVGVLSASTGTSGPKTIPNSLLPLTTRRFFMPFNQLHSLLAWTQLNPTIQFSFSRDLWHV